jgi:chromosomal replication initiation ATPase DnaA
MDEIERLIKEKDNVKSLIKCTCLIHNISIQDFNLNSRERRLIDARRMAYALSKDLLDFGWSRIGKEFKMNHASIIHHYKQHKSFLNTDKYYFNKYDSLLEVAKCEIGYVEIDSIIEEARRINKQRIEERLNIKNKIQEL